jgi:MoxR-like ATPase
MSTHGNFARFQGTPGYIASGPLMDAVNCAIALERPLLLKGEPGTGRTVGSSRKRRASSAGSSRCST